MKVGEFLASQYISAKDNIALRFKSWLGKDASRNYSERKWKALFKIFLRREG